MPDLGVFQKLVMGWVCSPGDTLQPGGPLEPAPPRHRELGDCQTATTAAVKDDDAEVHI